MIRNPFPQRVEERPHKRQRTERKHDIPERLEQLLAMSDGHRPVKESIWPKFPKNWNTWRMLKQEIQCDGVSGASRDVVANASATVDSTIPARGLRLTSSMWTRRSTVPIAST
jgi:hypothetical protein